LVATAPGVVLANVRSPWPMSQPTERAAGLAKQFEPFLPKLKVLVKDAVPLSIMNLRSAVQSKEAPELERQLTRLAVERLSRESPLFVLERRSMQHLTAEKELAGLDESGFWNGSYLLEGTLDRDGYARDVVTLNARLIPPGGGAPLLIDVTGSRTNLSQVIQQLTAKVLDHLKLKQTAPAWNPTGSQVGLALEPVRTGTSRERVGVGAGQAHQRHRLAARPGLRRTCSSARVA
jgi:hypothetical protein